MKETRAESIDLFLTDSFLKKANHYAVFMTGIARPWKHHFLLSEAKYYREKQVCKVSFIHYQPLPEEEKKEEEGSRGKGVVVETHIKFRRLGSEDWELMEGDECYFNLLKRGEWYLIENKGYPTDDEERDDAVTRARKKLNETRYSLVFNNCEHFVTEMLTGKGISYQVRKGLKKGSASSAVVSGAVASAAALLLK